MSEKFIFQVLEGEHQGQKRKYVKGDIFKSSHELDKLFVGKFQRMPSAGILDDDEEPQRVKVAVPQAQDIDPTQFDFSASQNVTSKYPEAATIGLEIYKDTLGGYAVADKTAKVKKNLADTALTSKQVKAFLVEWTKTSISED